MTTYTPGAARTLEFVSGVEAPTLDGVGGWAPGHSLPPSYSVTEPVSGDVALNRASSNYNSARDFENPQKHQIDLLTQMGATTPVRVQFREPQVMRNHFHPREGKSSRG